MKSKFDKITLIAVLLVLATIMSYFSYNNDVAEELTLKPNVEIVVKASQKLPAAPAKHKEYFIDKDINTKTYTNETIGISFDFPSEFEVESLSPKSKNESLYGTMLRILIRPRRWEKSWMYENLGSSHQLSIEVREGDIDKLTSDFIEKDNGWAISGRHGVLSPADKILINGFETFRGTADVGLHFKKGGYAGLGSVYVVSMILDDSHVVNFYLDITFEETIQPITYDDVNTIVESFRYKQ